MSLGPGTTVNGRYLIERELGRGGIGVVYLARDHRLHDMPVVIKFLLDDSTQSAWLSKKFLQEAEALTRIHHPGVVRVIDRDRTADDQPFFVMEFVEGSSLRSAIASRSLALDVVAAIVREIGQALSAAHREGVLHRDLKPENVMLETVSDGEQHAKLIDFGIAKVRDSREGASTELGTLAGSLHYLAPEQLLGAPASVASDVYAFAVIAYELLTGRRPFIPESANQIAAIPQLMTLQRAGQVVPPQQLRAGVSAAAQAILLRGLAFDPAARLADARQFGDDLAAALGAGARDDSVVTRPAAVAAPAADPASPPPSSAPRRRSALVAVASAVTLATVVGLTYLALSRRSPAEPHTLQQVQVAAAKTPQPAELRTLTYAVTLQRDPKRFPGKGPIQLSREAVFSAGDRVHLSFSSVQGGHLYIFNESPPDAGRARTVNVLFPSLTSHAGSSALDVGQTLRIPGHDLGFVFDAREGVETLSIVWSRTSLPGLEALKRWANPDDRGEIKAAADIDTLDTFLREHASPVPESVVDDVARTTTVSARADVFVRPIRLEHH